MYVIDTWKMKSEIEYCLWSTKLNGDVGNRDKIPKKSLEQYFFLEDFETKQKIHKLKFSPHFCFSCAYYFDGRILVFWAVIKPEVTPV